MDPSLPSTNSSTVRGGFKITSVRASGMWREMIREFYKIKSDIICLQDINTGDRDELMELLDNCGYKYIATCKKKRGMFCKPNDLLIASKFGIIESKHKLFETTSPLSSKLSNGIIYSMIQITEKLKLCVVNTHIDDVDAKQPAEDMRETRRNQLSEIDELLDALESCSDMVVLCGLLCDNAMTNGKHEIHVSDDTIKEKSDKKQDDATASDGLDGDHKGLGDAGGDSKTSLEEQKSETQLSAEKYFQMCTSQNKSSFDPSNPANIELVNRLMLLESKRTAQIPGVYPYVVYTPMMVPKIAKLESNAYKLISTNPLLNASSTSIAYPENNSTELSKAIGAKHLSHIDKYRDVLVETSFGYVPITDDDICCADLSKLGLKSGDNDGLKLLWPRIAKKKQGRPMRCQYILVNDTRRTKRRVLSGFGGRIDTMELDTMERLPLTFDESHNPHLSTTPTHSCSGYAVVADIFYSCR